MVRSSLGRVLGTLALSLPLILLCFVRQAAALTQLEPHPPSHPPPPGLTYRIKWLRGGAGHLPLPSQSRFGDQRLRRNSMSVLSFLLEKLRPAEEELSTGSFIGDRKTALSFMLLGAGGLLPWNTILIASDFFSSILTKYGIGHLCSALSLASVLPNVISAIITIWVGSAAKNQQTEGSLQSRISTGFVMQACMLAAILVGSLTLPNYASQSMVFGSLIVLVAAMGIADSFVQGGVMGYAATVSPKSAQYVATGQAYAGLLTCALRIATKLSASSITAASQKHSAGLFFVLSIGTLLVCRGVFHSVDDMVNSKPTHRRVFEHSTIIPDDEDSEESSISVGTPVGRENYMGNLACKDRGRKEIKDLQQSRILDVHKTKPLRRRLGGAVMVIIAAFVVSLGVFPGVSSQIRPIDSDPGEWFPLKMILAWNVGDLLGRKVAEKIPAESMKKQWWLLLLRAASIPFFIAVARNQDFLGAYHDMAALVGLIALAATMGYYASSASAYAARKVMSDAERQMAGQVMALSICIGASCGNLLSWPLGALV